MAAAAEAQLPRLRPLAAETDGGTRGAPHPTRRARSSPQSPPPMSSSLLLWSAAAGLWAAAVRAQRGRVQRWRHLLEAAPATATGDRVAVDQGTLRQLARSRTRAAIRTTLHPPVITTDGDQNFTCSQPASTPPPCSIMQTSCQSSWFSPLLMLSPTPSCWSC